VQNLVANHLSRIESKVDQVPISDKFLDDFLYSLNIVTTAPWFANILNYLVSSVVPENFSKSQANKLKSDAKYYMWDDPYLWRFSSDQVIRRCVTEQEIPHILNCCHNYAIGGHFGPRELLERS